MNVGAGESAAWQVVAASEAAVDVSKVVRELALDPCLDWSRQFAYGPVLDASLSCVVAKLSAEAMRVRLAKASGVTRDLFGVGPTDALFASDAVIRAKGAARRA